MGALQKRFERGEFRSIQRSTFIEKFERPELKTLNRHRSLNCNPYESGGSRDLFLSQLDFYFIDEIFWKFLSIFFVDKLCLISRRLKSVAA